MQKGGNRIIFHPRDGNKRLHDVSKDNNVRVVNFSTSKNLAVTTKKSPC
jgi:hypothetical protein